ncbi:37S ribosomal protein MRP17 [Purpureocillium lilacinum]|uniref:37S ribosomal protein MRP17 n=1 Tax=Purpureocillium lilacinum TaxID=33203 RepID=A0A2U3ENL0_PURLI|nr:37S ribosomal protein MRP17 [Purpureocillium lilacinum]
MRQSSLAALSPPIPEPTTSTEMPFRACSPMTSTSSLATAVPASWTSILRKVKNPPADKKTMGHVALQDRAPSQLLGGAGLAPTLPRRLRRRSAGGAARSHRGRFSAVPAPLLQISRLRRLCCATPAKRALLATSGPILNPLHRRCRRQDALRTHRNCPTGQPLRGEGVRATSSPTTTAASKLPSPPTACLLHVTILTARPRRIAHTVGSLVLKNGGVVRGLSNWGVFSLPKPVSVHQMKHTHGHYFVMRYDASTKVHGDVRNTLRLEPRMIRAAHVKLGDGKLETLSRFGAPKWRTQGSEA